MLEGQAQALQATNIKRDRPYGQNSLSHLVTFPSAAC